MDSLKEKIIEKIMSEGPITFETFMEMALYYPDLGYYTSKKIRIGRRGDFYTSSHLHPIFGAIIGKQLMEMWKEMGTPPDFHIVEIGGGAGYLSKDILDYLHRPSKNAGLSEDKSYFLKSLRYVIVELNPHVQESQKKLLGNYAETIKWLRTLKELTSPIKGCIFSNELLDAFPVHIVEMDDRLKEIYVAFNGEIIEQKQEVNDIDLIDYLKQFSINIPYGYRTEINLRIRDWLKDIASALSNGFLFTIDYGFSAKEYYHEERTKGTLLCYYKHQVNENPYKNIGQQDITAHINFTSVKEWGEDVGLKTIGYCPQGTFLIASGIDEVITELYSNTSDYTYEMLKIKGLILPQGMGESHKVMVQYKGEGTPTLQGFSMRNQAKSL